MPNLSSRRRFLEVLSIGLPAAGVFANGQVSAQSPAVSMLYPTQAPELVQEMVAVSHNNAARVKDLVERQPTLAKATWDWGFGDWESALGAASHVGNRAIADLLLSHGAHPTIFSAAMLGQLDVVKSYLTAAPALARTRGPHSISLLSHAMAGGPQAQAVVAYLKTVEGADDKPATQPLSDADAASLVGTYTFGVTAADRIEITLSKAQLQIARPGHFARGLFHLGGLVFCPMGAENVRIAFVKAADATLVTIRDPEVVLTARKTA
jgi:hypothetical protein